MKSALLAAVGVAAPVRIVGSERLRSRFAVTELAASSIATVGAALAELANALGFVPSPPGVRVERRLASLWFGWSLQPTGWTMPPAWDPIAGDYEGADGWIKIHTNLSHHKRSALSVLGCDAERKRVEAVVATWSCDSLEAAIVEAGGAAAAMRSRAAWRAHPQGEAVRAEPIVRWCDRREGSLPAWQPSLTRPLAGLRILDLTRVLAGPVATRTLAGFGAEVLRIDPPDWEEPNVVPDVTLGKRCARLDLTDAADRRRFEALLARAHVLVHGYRPDALERLGFGDRARSKIAPAQVDVRLDAYGWSGPWQSRRGFDSLVQMSSGIAAAGMEWSGVARPTPLPVQALDHATGYLMAASVVKALERSVRDGALANARLSLARTAELLAEYEQDGEGSLEARPEESDFQPEPERTPWGEARRLRAPIELESTPMHWTSPACDLGSAQAEWAERAGRSERRDATPRS